MGNCANCGAELIDAPFCVECGEAVAEAVPEAVAGAAAPAPVVPSEEPLDEESVVPFDDSPPETTSHTGLIVVILLLVVLLGAGAALIGVTALRAKPGPNQSSRTDQTGQPSATPTRPSPTGTGTAELDDFCETYFSMNRSAAVTDYGDIWRYWNDLAAMGLPAELSGSSDAWATMVDAVRSSARGKDLWHRIGTGGPVGAAYATLAADGVNACGN